MSSASNNNDLSVHSRFKEMNFSIGSDSNNLLLPWLEKHGKVFCGFSAGQWQSKSESANNSLHKIVDHFTGDHVCDVSVPTYNESNVSFYKKSAHKAFETWWCKHKAVSRSKILYKVAKTLEKYQQLLVAVESVSSGKHPSKVKAKDIPNLIESFYYYASCALEAEVGSNSWFPIGDVCIIAEEYNNTSLSLSLRVASLLAAGNAILVVADVKSCLSACLLAEICVEAGIPADVFNVIPVDMQNSFSIIKDVSSSFSKVLYTGSVDKGVLCKSATPFDVLIPRRPVVIVYENVDLYSAAEGVLEAFFYHDTRCQSGGCKLMLQQSIAGPFLKILEEMFSNIEVGSNSCKADMSCIVTEDQKKELELCLKEAENHSKIFRKSNVANLSYTYMQPTLISDVQPGFKLAHKELGGPLLIAITFRTVKESLAMFNCDNKGSPVSIWTDKIAVAVEVSRKLKSGTVWVNSQNTVNASSAFSGIYLSGNSVEGGKEAFFNHLYHSAETYRNDDKEIKQITETVPLPEIKCDRKEYKLYVGGVHKVSESGKALIRTNEIIYRGSGADVQNAVSIAVAAQSKWEDKSKHERRHILLSILGNMEKKKQEIINALKDEVGYSLEDSEKEVSAAIDILYYWSCQIDGYNCETQEIAKDTTVMQYRNPLGVIGIACSQDEKMTLLSFISLISPAIAFGNAVIAVVGVSLSVLKMCEVFDLSGVPGGVINVISGSHELVLDLGKNSDVTAVWITYLSPNIYETSHFTQRVFEAYEIWKDFNEAKSLKCVMASTFIKTIFLPSGEIFAN